MECRERDFEVDYPCVGFEGVVCVLEDGFLGALLVLDFCEMIMMGRGAHTTGNSAHTWVP